MLPVLSAFNLFGHPVVFFSYGTMLLAAMAAGIGLVAFLAGRAGFDRATMAMALLGVCLAALTGARMLGVATNFGEFAAGFPLSVFDSRIRGVVAYGGFIGGVAALWAMAHLYRWPMGLTMDLCALGAALGTGFARIGCFLSGCCFGCPSSLPWAVRFPAGSPAYVAQLQQGLIPAGAVSSLAVHPVQLYESGFGFLLFGVLLWRSRRWQGSGKVALAFFGLYALFRFGVEYFRCDAVRGIYAGLSTSQYLALAVVAVVSAVWRLQRRSGEAGRRRPA